MKKWGCLLSTLLLMGALSVTAMAAPAYPPFLSVSGDTALVNKPLNMQTYESFNPGFYLPDQPHMRSHITAVSRYWHYGGEGAAASGSQDVSGKYYYLHFISDAQGKGFRFTNSPSSQYGDIGADTIDGGGKLHILTFRYDPLTQSFDDGTIYDAVSGIYFDYIINSAPLSLPSERYPYFGKIGNNQFDTFASLPPYEYWIGAKKTQPSSNVLTIKYVYEDGTFAASSFVQTLSAGMSYKIASPQLPGYLPDVYTVSGTMAGQDVAHTVTYSKKAGGEGDTSKKLTIRFIYEDGREARPSLVRDHAPGYFYEYIPYSLPGYIPDRLVVAGYMPNRDDTQTVIYRSSTVTNPEQYYRLVIDYMDSDGHLLRSSIVVQVLPGMSYSYVSPVIPGYKADKLVVSGSMPDRDLYVKVVYSGSSSGGDGGGDSGSDDDSGGSGGSSSSGSGSDGSSSSGSGSDGSSSSGSGSGGSTSSGSGSGDSSSSGSSSGGSSSSGSGSGGSSSGGSGSGGDSSSGSGSGGSGSCVCDCGCTWHILGPCTADPFSPFCSCGASGNNGGGWDGLFPSSSEPDIGGGGFEIFRPGDYDNYTPPSSSTYDPMDGFITKPKVPTIPDPVVPPFTGKDPFHPGDSSASDPFHPGDSTASDPFKPGDSTASDPFKPGNSTASDPFKPGDSTASNPFKPGDSIASDPFYPGTPPIVYDPFDRIMRRAYNLIFGGSS